VESKRRLLASRAVTPEPFDPAEIESMASAAPWVRRVVCHAEIDSTNAEALRLAAAGADDGLVVVTDAQTAGRGRLGRSWWSEPGTALLASWLLRPAFPLERWPLLTLVAGVAAARAATAAAGVDVRLKWPNDLIVGDRKTGGILTESDGRGALVLGLGINVRQEDFPDEIRGTATSLVAAGGRAPVRAWLLAATLSAFGARMGDPDAVLDEYRSMCTTLGKRVRVERAGAAPIEGTASDVAASGALVVQIDGRTETVPAGDVVHLRPA
jgi:BirA family transcriptional regulator, biotin operon repressor / biotin---[acetyl-CoA-carboxylase] ligase